MPENGHVAPAIACAAVIAALAGCDARTKPRADTTLATSATAPAVGAPPAAPMISAEAAKARIEALPEIVAKRAREADLPLDIDSACTAESRMPCWHRITVGRDLMGRPELVFDIDAADGAIQVDADRAASYQRRPSIPYDQWHWEQTTRAAVVARIEELPEVAGYERAIRASKDVGLALYLLNTPPSRGCTSKSPGCSWDYYLGEAHGDHTVRWVNVVVDAETMAVSVIGYDARVVPYSIWKASPAAAKARAGRL